jgi:hypothetical protein
LKQVKTTIKTLKKYNEWRRGGEGEMPNPKEIGVAIDHAVDVLQSVENLLKQKGRHNTEVAYRALDKSAGSVEK